MTRLPVESWAVVPRLDLPSYDLNTVCPVTGETVGLEDHHIWRRSFTALGQENADVYWVTIQDGSKRTLKNRIALSPEAHQRVTTNIARLEYRDDQLWYIEGGEEKKLDLSLRLTTPEEKITRKRRPKASTPEQRKARVNYCIRTPEGEENVLPELFEALRDKLGPELGYTEAVKPYFIWVAAAARVLQ